MTLAAAASPESTKRDEVRQLEQRWTRPLLEPGWTVLPSVILERQQALGLDAMDLTIIMHLNRFWWYRDNPPHPSKKAIATCMNVDISTIRRRIARMEKDGLLQRVARRDAHGRQQTNFYRFDGLIKAAEPFAKESLDEKERKKAEAKRRIERKKPRLVASKET